MLATGGDDIVAPNLTALDVGLAPDGEAFSGAIGQVARHAGAALSIDRACRDFAWCANVAAPTADIWYSPRGRRLGGHRAMAEKRPLIGDEAMGPKPVTILTRPAGLARLRSVLTEFAET